MNRRASRRPRPQLFHIALFATLLIAVPGCSALRGAGGSPDPTRTPAPTSTPAPTDPPTPTPDPTQAGHIDHPTGATDVILRMEWGGGFVPPQTIVTQMAQFTLYGDGRAVFEPLQTSFSYDQPLPAFLTGQLSDDAVQDVLDYALHQGGLADAQTSYDFPGIADAGTTTFWINAGGVDKTVSVYALIESENNGPDKQDRDKLSALEKRLTNFETEARTGGVELSDYDPDTYKVVMFGDVYGSPADGADVIEWPWKDVKPSDFVAADESTWKVLNMNRADVAKLTDVPNGGQNSVWVKAPDGSTVSFALRPLLPDEVSTPAQPSATD